MLHTDTALLESLVSERGDDGQLLRQLFRLHFDFRAFILGQRDANCVLLEKFLYYGPRQSSRATQLIVLFSCFVILLFTGFREFSNPSDNSKVATIIGLIVNGLLCVAVAVDKWVVSLWSHRASIVLKVNEIIAVTSLLVSFLCAYRTLFEVQKICLAEAQTKNVDDCNSTAMTVITFVVVVLSAAHTAEPKWHALIALMVLPVAFLMSSDVPKAASSVGLARRRATSAFVCIFGVAFAFISWLSSRRALEAFADSFHSRKAFAQAARAIDNLLPKFTVPSLIEKMLSQEKLVAVLSGEALLLVCQIDASVMMTVMKGKTPLEIWMLQDNIVTHFVETMLADGHVEARNASSEAGTAVWLLTERLVSRCVGDTFFSVSRRHESDEEARGGYSLAKEIRWFLRLAMRCHSGWGKVNASGLIRTAVHRGYVACACLGRTALRIEPFGTAIIEAQECFTRCNPGELITTTPIAQSHRDAFPMESRGMVSVWTNPIPIEVFFVPSGGTHTGKQEEEDDHTVPRASGKHEAHKKKSFSRKGDAVGKKEVRVVSVEEEEMSQHLHSQMNSMDALLKVIMAMGSNGSSNELCNGSFPAYRGGCEDHSTNTAKLLPFQILTDARSRLLTYKSIWWSFSDSVKRQLGLAPDSPLASNRGSQDDDVFSTLEKRFWRHISVATQTQRVAVQFINCSISAVLVAVCLGYDDIDGAATTKFAFAAVALIFDVISTAMLVRSGSYQHFITAFMTLAALCSSVAVMITRPLLPPTVAVYTLLRGTGVMLSTPHVLSWVTCAVMTVAVLVPVIVNMSLRITDATRTASILIYALCAGGLFTLCAQLEMMNRESFLDRRICALANQNMAAVLKLQRTVLERFVGPNATGELLRSGLKCHSPTVYQNTVVLSFDLPAMHRIQRQQLPASLAELHQLRLAVDHITFVYGFERQPSFGGDQVLAIDFYGDLTTPQLNIRRIKGNFLEAAEANTGVDAFPSVISVDGDEKRLRPAVRWKLRLAVELWATIMTTVSTLFQSGDSDTSPSISGNAFSSSHCLPREGAASGTSSMLMMPSITSAKRSLDSACLGLGRKSTLGAALTVGDTAMGFAGSHLVVVPRCAGPALVEAKILMSRQPPESNVPLLSALTIPKRVARDIFPEVPWRTKFLAPQHVIENAVQPAGGVASLVSTPVCPQEAPLQHTPKITAKGADFPLRISILPRKMIGTVAILSNQLNKYSKEAKATAVGSIRFTGEFDALEVFVHLSDAERQLDEADNEAVQVLCCST